MPDSWSIRQRLQKYQLCICTRTLKTIRIDPLVKSTKNKQKVDEILKTVQDMKLDTELLKKIKLG